MPRVVIRAPLPTLLRYAAWGCFAILAVLSLLPGQDLVRTDLTKLGYGKQIEHVIAYFGATTFVGLAYRTRLTRLTAAIALISYAGLLEIGQLYVAGRGASVWDFAASAIGVLIGLAFLPIAWRGVDRVFATSRE